MNSVLTFTLMTALFTYAVVGDSTDPEEKFIADKLTKAVDELAGIPGDLQPKEFDHKVKSVLDSKEVKEKSEEMIKKALKPEWKADHKLNGINQMVSPTLSTEITNKLGKLEKATKELTKDADFKARYLNAVQYMKEILNDQLNVIETNILKNN